MLQTPPEQTRKAADAAEVGREERELSHECVKYGDMTLRTEMLKRFQLTPIKCFITSGLVSML